MRLTWLPNALTLMRCVLAVAVGGLLLAEAADGFPVKPDATAWPTLAFVAFLLAALTDLVDGWLARRLDAVSDFGRLLDPIADKLLVGIPLIVGAVLVAPHVPELLLIPVVIVGRDVAVTLLRFSPRGGAKVHVTWPAKVKTALELVAIGFVLAVLALADQGAIGLREVTLAFPVGIALLAFAALFSAWTGIDYFRAAFDPQVKERGG